MPVRAPGGIVPFLTTPPLSLNLRQSLRVLPWVLAGAALAALAWSRWTSSPAGNVPAKAARSRQVRPLPRELVVAVADRPALLEILRQGKAPALTAAQLEDYLRTHARSPASLLVASRLSGDPAFLRAAAEAAPDDPAVQLELALRGGDLAERAAAAEAFRRLSPGNALGDYLMVQVSFEKGDFAAAASALDGATENDTLADHSAQLVAGMRDAYLGAGYEASAAQVAAMASLDRRPQLDLLRNVGTGLGQLLVEFIREGDIDTAEPVVLAGQSLGQRLHEGSPYLLDQMAGIELEKSFLAQLDPVTVFGADGVTVGERIAELDARWAEASELTSVGADAWSSLSAAQAEQYVEVVRRDGELAGLRWLKAQAVR